MCFGCSKETSHRDGSFEYPQHMFCFRNKKNNFQICTLIWRPEPCYKGTILLRYYGNITILWSFSYNSFVKLHGKKFGSHNMTLLYPNLCYNEVCYKGTALYMFHNLFLIISHFCITLFANCTFMK